jgi:uncharacterized protein (TIGR03089 family)
VHLDLPPHWRALVWALATWRCGACVVVGDAADVDVVVTDRPADAPTGAQVVAVALPALARSFGAPLPADAVDGSAVLSYGDVVTWAPATDASSLALATPGVSVVHAALLADPLPGTARVALPADDLATVLRTALATWAADGSVVLVEAGTASVLRADHARRERVLGPEQITDDRLGPRSPA